MLNEIGICHWRENAGYPNHRVGQEDDDENGLEVIEEESAMSADYHREIVRVHSAKHRGRRRVYRGAKSRELDWSGIAKVAFITTAVIAAAYFALAL